MWRTEGCYVIAEIGVNHNGSVAIARDLIDVAAMAGADAVKFQSFSADDLVTRDAERAEYQSRNTGDAGSQHSMLSALELTEDDTRELMTYCSTLDIDFLSTPFGEAPADMLERLGVKGFKVSSGDLTHLPFLAHLAAKRLPIIISTGMATLTEVSEAVATIDEHGPADLAILHCVSDYPARAESCNLAAMDTMQRAFGRPVGWSDHTMGPAVGFAAVALGARLIEKHITLDTSLDGPDHAASMEPDDFRDYVAGIRAIQASIGDGVKRPMPEELRTATVARRSLVAVRDLVAGDRVRREDVAVMRPGTGLPPRMLEVLIGTRIGRDVAANRPITLDDLHG